PSMKQFGLYNSLFLVNDQNELIVLGVRQKDNTENGVVVETMNQIELAGPALNLHISDNGGFVYIPFKIKKYMLDSMTRLFEICAKLKMEPENPFLQSYKESCRDSTILEPHINL